MTQLGPRVRCDEDRVLRLAKAGLTNAQIVAELGICDRTFTRWRVARPALSARIIAVRADLVTIPACGTLAGYRRHLRRREPTDRACREANNLHVHEQDVRRRERLGLPPADPRRGRPRGQLQPSTALTRASDATQVTRTGLVEQAIARGRSTSWIMAAHGLTYQQFRAIRDAMADGAA